MLWEYMIWWKDQIPKIKYSCCATCRFGSVYHKEVSVMQGNANTVRTTTRTAHLRVSTKRKGFGWRGTFEKVKIIFLRKRCIRRYWINRVLFTFVFYCLTALVIVTFCTDAKFLLQFALSRIWGSSMQLIIAPLLKWLMHRYIDSLHLHFARRGHRN